MIHSVFFKINSKYAPSSLLQLLYYTNSFLISNGKETIELSWKIKTWANHVVGVFHYDEVLQSFSDPLLDAVAKTLYKINKRYISPVDWKPNPWRDVALRLVRFDVKVFVTRNINTAGVTELQNPKDNITLTLLRPISVATGTVFIWN